MYKAILEELASCHPYAEPELALLAGANMRMKNPVSLTELRKMAESLESKGLLAIITNELDQTRKYKITDNGRAAIAS